jgi:acetyltransferase-like isoleucine patch superfamily enzyme
MDLRSKLRDRHLCQNGGVMIGNDVWLDLHFRVLSGVKVGDGASIAAGAPMSGTAPPYVIVGGVPAKEIRFRFTEDQIATFLRIAWPEWVDNMIRPRADDLSSFNIDIFIKTYANP